MVIIGAKGYAKELLEIFYQKDKINDLVFFDDVSIDLPELLFGRFTIFKNIDEVSSYFKLGKREFVLGLGNPAARKKLFNRFIDIGGVPSSVISPNSEIGHFDNSIGIGVNIMSGTIITNSVHIGDGSLINLNCTIGHDSNIGSFCELSPGVHVSGHVKLGDECSIGTGAVILPHIKIGNSSVVGAGAVVNKDLPDNCVAVGIPAKIIKQN